MSHDAECPSWLGKACTCAPLSKQRGNLFDGENPWAHDGWASRALAWERARWKHQTRPRLLALASVFWLIAFALGYTSGVALMAMVRR